MKLSLETVAIGDELLTGKIADTNSAYVANLLFARGLRLERVSVIPDELSVIQQTLSERGKACDVLICFGGLGPTSDDRTAEAVAGLIGGGLSTDAASKVRLLDFLEKRGRAVTEAALKQVLYPTSSEPLANFHGLAPGFHCKIGRAEAYFLPGVPSEMKALFQESVLPVISARVGGTAMLTHSWRCLRLPESELQVLMTPVEKALPSNAYLGYRTRFPENHLTLYWRSEGANEAFESVKARISEILGAFTYTEGENELENLVLGKLASRGFRLALAESCTGGLVTDRLVRIPGSSEQIWGGYTCYRIEAKAAMLGVQIANASESVGRGVTKRLAEAAQAKSGCAVSAAITGYLGPTGGTDEIPTGSLFLCVLVEGKAFEESLRLFGRTRVDMQWGAATHLLDAIHRALQAV